MIHQITALAGEFRLPALPCHEAWAPGPRPAALPPVPRPSVGQGRDRVCRQSPAVEGLVSGDVAHYQPEERGQRLGPPADQGRARAGCTREVIGPAQAQLDYYLDEFTFRFNRRNSRSRGKLFYRSAQQAVQISPHPCARIARPQPQPVEAG